MSFRNVLAITILIALAACGGGNKQTSSAESANPSPGTEVNALASVPPGLNCGAVRAVWVNTKTHVYHEPSDPYYGRTKHGEYMCPSQAVNEGYHKARGHKERSQ